jgi:hypothetical protein
MKMIRPSTDGHEANDPDLVNRGLDYEWHDMSFISCWKQPDRCQVMCIDTPRELLDGIYVALVHQLALDFQGPFTMHQSLVDQILELCNIAVW